MRSGRVPEPPRTGLYKRFFAWLLSKLQRHYGEQVDRRKQELLGALQGTVVEVGVGAGANFEFYPRAVRLIVVEPNAHMYPYLEEMARRHDVTFEVRRGTAECMEVADTSADFVVCTLVLCSVDDPQAALQEVVRVLKPGGRFIFLEHVAAPRGTATRRWQRRLRGFWRRIGDGCTLDRETWASIENAGFSACDIEHFEADNIAIAKPHIAGTATKAGASLFIPHPATSPQRSHRRPDSLQPRLRVDPDREDDQGQREEGRGTACGCRNL